MVINSLKTKICILVVLTLTLVAVPVLYFTHKDGVRAMSEAEQRSIHNILELTEMNIRSGYRNLLYSRVDAVMAHRRTLEGMVLVARMGLDEIFSSGDNAVTRQRALNWVSQLASVNGTEFLVFDARGHMMAHPDSGIRGKNVNLIKDIKGIPLGEAIHGEAKRLGQASTTFFWAFDEQSEPLKKYGWFVHYPAMDWILGATADIGALELEGKRKQTELLNNLEANFRNIHIGQSGSVFLFDRQGDLLIPPARENPDFLHTALQERDATLFQTLKDLASSGRGASLTLVLPDENQSPGKREILCTYFPALGWYLAVMAHTDETHAPAKALVTRLTLIIASLFCISLFVGLWLSIRMTRPLNTLASFAKALPDTDFTSSETACAVIAHLPDCHKDEVGRLARAIIFMESSLRENIRSLVATTAINERMEGELGVAREIQLGLLPKTFPPFPNHREFDLHASLEPAREVGGDLYDFFFMDDSHFCFAVGDVSGKGVPASLFMAITRTLLRAAAAREKDPARMLASMNNDLASSNPNSMFVTLFIGILNLETGHLLYANGGHNPPVLMTPDDKAIFLTGRSGPLVGAMEDMPYHVLETALHPGDTLFLYTDGITEAMDTEQRLYTDPRLLNLLDRLQGFSPEAILKEIDADVALHVGEAEPSDDITMLCLRYTGPVS
ncbi:SpoIIE family protein phosphatase [Desulfobotulus sp. H1]|uniref:SpoIIE family protein phosphatase n=1 Tax=Desulfobotulus pelophilus TaxID=2823377 RepID=A0ABT3N9W9_9BACT|nr:SpoIIE family protein phosphatase [Desulfobotulus pelophilus]MCW7754256.1 SpoIIE family protein phosphatase [Desulfobotulus pelophilus]